MAAPVAVHSPRLPRCGAAAAAALCHPQALGHEHRCGKAPVAIAFGGVNWPGNHQRRWRRPFGKLLILLASLAPAR
jgi:hypothetical protein